MTQSENKDGVEMSEDDPISYRTKGKWRDSSPLHFIHEHQTESESEGESDIEADMFRAAVALSKETSAHHQSMYGAGSSTNTGFEQKGDLAHRSNEGMRNGFYTSSFY